jgi:hypothetical protein
VIRKEEEPSTVCFTMVLSHANSARRPEGPPLGIGNGRGEIAQGRASQRRVLAAAGSAIEAPFRRSCTCRTEGLSSEGALKEYDA